MQITIAGVKYHLAFRIIVRCQLRNMDAGHYVMATGEAICLPGDPFDEKEGKRKAFSQMIRDLQRLTPETSVLHDKRERRKIWSQFLFWLSGKKKPQVKMKKKPIKLTQEGEPTPLATGIDHGLYLSADKAEQSSAHGLSSAGDAGRGGRGMGGAV